MRPVWNLVEALEFVQQVTPVVARAGFGLALGGSVLTKGESRKDLDLVLFPLRIGKEDVFDLRTLLTVELQMRMVMDQNAVKDEWRRIYGSDDTKHVEVWTWLGKRIDLFFLK